MKKLRWGIVSTGRISEQFCHDMQFVINGELAAVAARKIADANRFANKHNIPKAYQGYQSLFDDDTIDVVYISTPHTFHFQNAKDALLAGKSVLCEKPITVSPSECEELMALAKKRGLFLMEGMWTFFLPAIQRAKKWIASGKIGNIKHIKADFGYPIEYSPNRREYASELAGGCLLEMGIYPLAIAHFFSHAPTQLPLVDAHYAPNGVEDDVIMVGNADEIRLTLATSFQCKLQNWAYIIGDKGYIAIPDFWRANQCYLYELDTLVDSFNDNRESLGFNYEATAVGEMIIAQQNEHPTMSHETSLFLQQQMTDLKSRF